MSQILEPLIHLQPTQLCVTLHAHFANPPGPVCVACIIMGVGPFIGTVDQP